MFCLKKTEFRRLLESRRSAKAMLIYRHPICRSSEGRAKKTEAGHYHQASAQAATPALPNRCPHCGLATSITRFEVALPLFENLTKSSAVCCITAELLPPGLPRPGATIGSYPIGPAPTLSSSPSMASAAGSSRRSPRLKLWRHPSFAGMKSEFVAKQVWMSSRAPKTRSLPLHDTASDSDSADKSGTAVVFGKAE